MTKSNYGQYAIDMYLEYFNSYLTLDKFAEHHDISPPTAYALINRGRKLYEATCNN